MKNVSYSVFEIIKPFLYFALLFVCNRQNSELVEFPMCGITKCKLMLTVQPRSTIIIFSLVH